MICPALNPEVACGENSALNQEHYRLERSQTGNYNFANPRSFMKFHYVALGLSLLSRERSSYVAEPKQSVSSMHPAADQSRIQACRSVGTLIRRISQIYVNK